MRIFFSVRCTDGSIPKMWYSPGVFPHTHHPRQALRPPSLRERGRGWGDHPKMVYLTPPRCCKVAGLFVAPGRHPHPQKKPPANAGGPKKQPLTYLQSHLHTNSITISQPRTAAQQTHTATSLQRAIEKTRLYRSNLSIFLFERKKPAGSQHQVVR